MNRIKNRQDLQRNNFLIPVIIAIFVLVLIVRYFWGSSPEEEVRGGAQYVEVTPNAGSKVSIYMSGDSKKDIETVNKLFPTDKKVVVATGEASIALPGQGKLILDERAELVYVGEVNGQNIFDLITAKAWMSGGKKSTLRIKFLQVTPLTDEAVLFIFQNAVASSVTVLKGSALIQGREGSDQITLGIGQKITITNADSISGKFLLQEKVVPIDAEIQNENLYARHGEGLLIGQGGSSGTGETQSGSGQVGSTQQKKLIRFTLPEDESTLDAGSTEIAGSYLSDTISKLTVNDIQIPLQKEDKTFEVKNFQLKKGTNNLVYKTYDTEGILLEKGIITVYAQKGVNDQSIGNTDPKIPSVKTFPISSKDFPIISPNKNPFPTEKSVIKIEGRVPKQAVKYITINGYRLTRFVPYGTYWYYFANKDQGTLNEGINTYEIYYYGANDEKIAENFVSIVKSTIIEEGSGSTTP